MSDSNSVAVHRCPIVKGFFEKRTSSIQYVVADPETKRAAIIDPVLDYDTNSGATATHSADELLAYIKREGYALEWILDTHPHADHFSAAGYLKDETGVPTAIASESTVPNGSWWEGATSTSRWRITPGAFSTHSRCSTASDARTAAR